MAWYEDPNLVFSLLVNMILLIVGLWRRGLLYPLAGLVLTSVTYNYYSSDYNIPLVFLGFVLGHLIALVQAIRHNL